MYRKVAERAPSLGLVLRQALEWQMLSTGPTEISHGAATANSQQWVESGGEWERAVLFYRIGKLVQPFSMQVVRLKLR